VSITYCDRLVAAKKSPPRGWGEPVAATGLGRPHTVRLAESAADEVEVVLHDSDRALLLNKTLCDPELVEKLRPDRVPGMVIGSYGPEEFDDLLGFVAAESNRTRSKKVRASLDDLYARLEEFESQARRL
jgi:hypothetical protein